MNRFSIVVTALLVVLTAPAADAVAAHGSLQEPRGGDISGAVASCLRRIADFIDNPNATTIPLKCVI